MVNIKDFILIAQGTEAFSPQEISVLEEILTAGKIAGIDTDWGEQIPDYIIFEEKHKGLLTGYVIFGKTPMTAHGWDLYWIVVDKAFQGKGVGSTLLKKVELYLSRKYGFAHLRLETSSRHEYSATRSFYLKNGFKEVGRIDDFYSTGDDLLTFHKKISAGD